MVKRIAVLIAAVAAVLVAAPATAAVHPPRPVHQVQSAVRAQVVSSGYYSSTWAGYVATGNTFRSVTATFTVPAIACPSAGDNTVYQWAGLDGLFSDTVEQSGVAEWCPPGYPVQYEAFADMYPAGATWLFTVKPGDTVTASTVYDVATGKFQLKVTDATSGASKTVSVACAAVCARSSAEVISEGYQGYEPQFGQVTFSNIAISDGSTLLDSGWVTSYVIQGQPGDVGVQPEQPDTAGDSFTDVQEQQWG